MKMGSDEPKFPLRLPRDRTPCCGCLGPHRSSERRHRRTLAVLRPRATLTSRFDDNFGRKHHARSRNGGAS
jgi:hypothetical protein